jgi:hypothetical protein
MTVTPGTGGDVQAVADLTPAYGGSDAIDSWTRSIDFSAGMLTVHDVYATASDTSATFQIDVPVEPTISGNAASAGDLRVDVISPANATLSAIDWTTVDGDFNSGWRIDIGGGTGEYIVVLRSAAATGDAIFSDGFEP